MATFWKWSSLTQKRGQHNVSWAPNAHRTKGFLSGFSDTAPGLLIICYQFEKSRNESFFWYDVEHKFQNITDLHCFRMGEFPWGKSQQFCIKKAIWVVDWESRTFRILERLQHKHWEKKKKKSDVDSDSWHLCQRSRQTVQLSVSPALYYITVLGRYAISATVGLAWFLIGDWVKGHISQ